MSDRLTNCHIDLYARPEGGSAWIDGQFVITSGDNTALVRAAQEVLASRKLIADLRALHKDRRHQFGWVRCAECQHTYPCPTIRLIDEAQL